MSDGEECDTGVLGRLVHVALNVYAHGAGAFIQQSKRWSEKRNKTDRIVNNNVVVSIHPRSYYKPGSCRYMHGIWPFWTQCLLRIRRRLRGMGGATFMDHINDKCARALVMSGPISTLHGHMVIGSIWCTYDLRVCHHRSTHLW